MTLWFYPLLPVPSFFPTPSSPHFPQPTFLPLPPKPTASISFLHELERPSFNFWVCQDEACRSWTKAEMLACFWSLPITPNSSASSIPSTNISEIQSVFREPVYILSIIQEKWKWYSSRIHRSQKQTRHAFVEISVPAFKLRSSKITEHWCHNWQGFSDLLPWG